jgi:hypothetical protein
MTWTLRDYQTYRADLTEYWDPLAMTPEEAKAFTITLRDGTKVSVYDATYMQLFEYECLVKQAIHDRPPDWRWRLV